MPGEREAFQKFLPITITVEVPGLPPDPGDAGKATLEGIDSENDGVRDDVQRYIRLLAMRGVPLQVIAEVLGHTATQISRHYAHLLPSYCGGHDTGEFAELRG